MPKEFEKFVASQKGLLFKDDKCLILKINPELINQDNAWDLPGGRLDKGEDYSLGLKRELEEEIGLSNFDVLGVADCTFWWTPVDGGSPIVGIIYAIQADNQEIILSGEHVEMKWISQSEIDNYHYIWPHMHKALKKGFQLYNLYKNSTK